MVPKPFQHRRQERRIERQKERKQERRQGSEEKPILQGKLLGGEGPLKRLQKIREANQSKRRS